MALWIGVASVLGCSPDGLGQLPAVGGVRGYLCHPTRNELAPNARVAGQGQTSKVETTTDIVGFFTLEGLVEGAQALEVTGGDFTSTLAVDVVAGQTRDLPLPSCLQTPVGTIAGRVCGVKDGYWISGAKVYVEIGTQPVQTISDAQGDFVLPDVPAGERILEIEKGSFHTSLAVTVPANDTLTLAPVCVAKDAHVVAITGVNDSMETLLGELGFEVGACIPQSFVGCPASLVAGGGITLVDGSTSAYITDYLADAGQLASTSVIFFNCGLADQYFANSPPGDIQNLVDFVRGGGSIFVSDYAYEIIRVAFPGLIDFWGNDDARDLAKVGKQATSITGQVTQRRLEDALGFASVQLMYNKPNWVVLAKVQAASVLPWVQGSVDIAPPAGDQTLSDAPLLVTTRVGAGSIGFTTFHMAKQTGEASADMKSILKFMIFEL